MVGEVGGAAAQVERQLQLALVMADAESVGAMQTAFDMTVEWAFDRYSFGRPLASYQELKHRFADMKTWLEASHAISDAVGRGGGRRSRPRPTSWSAWPRPTSATTASELIQDCVQIHGGIGVTFEHDLHLYLRRLTVEPGAVRHPGRSPAAHRRHRASQGGEHDARPDAVERRGQLPAAGPRVDPRQPRAGRIGRTCRGCSATTEPTRRSSPPSPGTARSSACSSTPGWPASASRPAYGGQGLTPAHQRALNEELVGFEYPTRFQAPTFSPCAAVLLEFGTEEQKLRHLPAILRGEELWMQFLSEPSGGSDVAGALTTAVRDGDEWVLNGSKVWTTGAWWSDWGLCLARTNWDVPKHRGSTVFMLPIHQPGIEVHRIEMLNGSKEFCQEFMTDVRVPDSDRIGDVDDGWTVGIRWMFHERMLHNSPYVTIAGERGPQRLGAVLGARGRPRRRAASTTRAPATWWARPACSRWSADQLQRRHRPKASLTGAMSRPVGRHRPPVRRGDRPPAPPPSRFELAGAAGAAWTDDDGDLADCGIGLPDAPGVLHRRRDHRDGPQRDQRAGAGHAPRAHPRPRRRRSATCPEDRRRDPGRTTVPELAT